MVFVRKSPGRSGSAKVQIAERRAGRDVVLEHVGTARTDAELAVLMAQARRRIEVGQDALDLGLAMATRNYRKDDEDFKQGAVRLVFETGKPIAQVARDLGINDGTLGNWVAKARDDAGESNGELSETERAELARLRKEHRAADAA